MNDDPSMHDKVTRPRTYVLSGDRALHVQADTGRASVALAVLGDMLTAAELDLTSPYEAIRRLAIERLQTLREARQRISAAEAEYADRYGTVEP